MLYEYKLEGIELKIEEEDDFLNFIGGMLKDVYGESIIYFDKFEYRGIPSLLIQLGKKGRADVEILIIAHRVPHIRIVALNRENHVNVRKILNTINSLAFSYRRKSTLYYVYVYGEEVHPSRLKWMASKITGIMFSNNMVFFFAFSMVLSSIIHLFLNNFYTFMALFFFLSFIQFISYKIPTIMCDWSISSKEKTIFIIGISLPLRTYNMLVRDKSFRRMYDIKRKIYDFVINEKKKEIAEFFSNFCSVTLSENDVFIIRRDIFTLVREISLKMNISPPRIFLKKSLDLNAVAMGFFHKFSTLTVTAGLVAELREEELKAVLAHEISHIKHRDTLILYALTSLLYLIQFHLYFTELPVLFTISIQVMIILVFLTIFFFIAKVMEIRADLEAATISNSLNLASAIQKTVLLEIVKHRAKLREWISWTPHPPPSYRIHLLRREFVKKGGWMQALKFCLRGLLKSII